MATKLVNGVRVEIPAEDFDRFEASRSVKKDIRKVRANSSLTKSEFVLACVGAGILTDAEALAVGRGGWPNAMNDFLAYLTPQQALTVQLEWASVKDIRRTNVFVMTLGSWLGISDDDLDDLFGIGDS